MATKHRYNYTCILVTESPVLLVVATDVFCCAELVWLVWPVLEEAIVMGGWRLVTDNFKMMEEEVVLPGFRCACELGKWNEVIKE